MAASFYNVFPKASDKYGYSILKLFIWFFIIMVLIGCGTIERRDLSTALEEGVFLQRDAEVCVNGKCGVGMIVATFSGKYEFEVNSEAVPETGSFATCHREEIFKHKKKWFRNNKKIKGDFRPTPGIEDGYCPAYFGAWSTDGNNAFAFVDFETGDARLPAKLFCNGEKTEAGGVSVCQSREGLVQVIEFEEPVFANNCGLVGTKSRWEFEIPKGECVVAFIGKNDIHRLTLYGYERPIVR